MKRLLALAAIAFLAAACASSDGETSSTSTVSGSSDSVVAAGPDAEWSSVVLDSVGLTGVGSLVLTDGDGGLVIIYQREVEPGHFETLVASCADVECTDPAISRVTLPERSGVVEAALGGGGAPIILLARTIETDGESTTSTVLLVCVDPTCASFEETVIAEAIPLGLAVAPDGASVVAYASWDDTGSAGIHVGLCGDAACRVHDPVLVGSSWGFGIGSGALQLLPDGSPVLYYEDSASPVESSRLVAVCGDPACSSVVVTEVRPGMTTDGDAVSEALPYWPYVSHSESVRLIACGDERCATILERELHRRFDGTMIVAADVSVGAEGTPFMAIETISQNELSGEDGDEYATHQVSWVMCGDPSCETVSVRELGEGNTTSMVSLPDGSIAVAAQTGRPNVCLLDCVDLAAEGLSTLTLYSCRGPGCSLAASEDLEPVAGDVAVADGGVGSAIVFAAEGDLYVLDPGPGTPGRLTEGPDWDGGPVWSPDGSRIAFHTDRDATEADRFENYNIYVIDTDGSNTVQVTDHAAGEFFPDWSPDGTSLVFARQTDQADTRHLVIVDLATGEEQQLTDPTSDANIPAWSPDGTKIAFSGRTSGDCTWEGTDCNTAIFTINTDGTGITQLSDAPGIDSFPDWSPDGREIAFHTTRTDSTSGRWDIFVMSLDGMDISPLTDYPGADQFPSWSADGAMVLFQSDRSGIPHLYTMRGTDGSDLTLIAPSTPNASFPDWSPTSD